MFRRGVVRLELVDTVVEPKALLSRRASLEACWCSCWSLLLEEPLGCLGERSPQHLSVGFGANLPRPRGLASDVRFSHEHIQYQCIGYHRTYMYYQGGIKALRP
jgi:hypothetical protein